MVILLGLQVCKNRNVEPKDWNWVTLSSGEVFSTEHRGIAEAQLEVCQRTSSKSYDYRVAIFPKQKLPKAFDLYFDGELIE